MIHSANIGRYKIVFRISCSERAPEFYFAMICAVHAGTSGRSPLSEAGIWPCLFVYFNLNSLGQKSNTCAPIYFYLHYFLMCLLISWGHHVCPLYPDTVMWAYLPTVLLVSSTLLDHFSSSLMRADFQGQGETVELQSNPEGCWNWSSPRGGVLS